MQKHSLAAGIFLIVSLISPAQVIAESSVDQMEEDIFRDMNLDGITVFWEKIIADYGNFMPDLQKVSIFEGLNNVDKNMFTQFFLNILQFFFHELIVNGKLLGIIIVLAIFSSILETMHSAFEQSSIQRISFFIVYLVLIFISLNSFYTVFDYINGAISTMSSFMIALIPLILGLMATFGNLISVAFFHPIIIILIELSSLLISKFILPVLLVSALFMLVSNLNPNYSVTHFAKLLRTIALASLGIFFTIFISIISVQGAANAIQDGVALKTAKFVTANFVPVIGRTFIDATDTVLSATLILKNTVGIAGVIITLLIVLFPALKVLSITLLFKFSAAIIQPIASEQIVTCLQVIGNYMSYMLACLLGLSFMFFLGIVIIIAASNITLLLQ
ncbi:stage III sporulation protein AE [Ornithinibacillus sp. 4-3]|uniref:Stage III sporulation protein AE n=1 Tax=Ornithinibacillus sp. 4-3 TaxID=3231488 RepID=A0AB39HKY2_9BACI